MSADDDGDENLMKLVFYSEISVGNYLIVLAKFNLMFEQKLIHRCMKHIHIQAPSIEV